MSEKEYGTFILKPDVFEDGNLEDKDLFEKDICSRFIFESGIMCRENIVYLEQLKENYIVKAPYVNEREV